MFKRDHQNKELPFLGHVLSSVLQKVDAIEFYEVNTFKFLWVLYLK